MTTPLRCFCHSYFSPLLLYLPPIYVYVYVYIYLFIFQQLLYFSTFLSFSFNFLHFFNVTFLWLFLHPFLLFFFSSSPFHLSLSCRYTSDSSFLKETRIPFHLSFLLYHLVFLILYLWKTLYIRTEVGEKN
ncbi:hypothetical protein, unlikely [Trypanosoma brucei gambiense DAL972]|uniref:Uncharacterized protein n=1 Tax=Trypanosoma brucei gambiense (strain MHOM/CI/86/DAL972) TaxID=679716 RepID=C9ZRN3_TRYB9|nr:hypothetical protein, unlikely [Trypanosoma brucei gambiense DAL972]CBH12335.1 hypothetical protein, unlikely [Trypanosoma brucei gambiense DAL972]|eukprot:XP_011774616.1 hypothetical protein, unlikely [Trypanosoma brucei gambiense DAL972]